LNSYFKDVIDFLQANDLNTMEDGKYAIKGDDLFLNLTTTAGKAPDEAVLETHNRMLDIQIPLSSAETYGYTPRTELPEGTYNDEKDITKFPGLAAQSYLTCQPGMFAIFFPQDGHAPCISMDSTIRKAIFKAKV
jgi:YhcH/YjgK/YiaL family protein